MIFHFMPIIYAITGAQTRAVKIGKTTGRTAEGRCKQLQQGSAEVLTVLGEAPGRPGVDERVLHTLFAPYHLHGEWFDRRVTDVIVEALKTGTFAEWVEGVLEDYKLDPIGFVCRFYQKVKDK
jgi:hypothetical protein